MYLDIDDKADYEYSVAVRSVYSKSVIVEVVFAFSILSKRSLEISCSAEDARKIVLDPLLQPMRDLIVAFGEEGMTMDEFNIRLLRKQRELDENHQAP